MANRKGITKKKPSIEKFAEVTEACRGVISKIADGLNVDRTTILALGIPKLDNKNQVIGWKERPDGQMLRYFISTLGRREGYGEQIDVTSKGESIKPDPVVIEVIDSRMQVQKSDKEQE